MAGKKAQISMNGWNTPVWSTIVKTHKNFKSNYQGAIMFAHYELSSGDLKKEVVKYLKNLDAKHPLLERIKDINDDRFSTVGKYMYILNHGGEVPDDVMKGMMPSLEKSIEEEEHRIAQKKEAETPVVTTVKTSVPSIQDRLKERAREVAGEIEGWLDDLIIDPKISVKTVEEFVNLFKANELKAPHMRHMRHAFERRAAQAEMVAESKDKDVLEYYSNFTKSELKKFSIFYQNILKATDMLQEVAKAVRAPRKKKPVSQEKLVAKLKYKKEDTALGLVSVNPVQIIGSKEVWTYNTKTRKLAQYKAADIRGLTVKGASIENFSSESLEKTLRKPTEALAEFKKASKVKLRTFLKDLSTVDVPAPGKMNEHIVILRVDK